MRRKAAKGGRMIKTEATFASPADFENYWGIDLEAELTAGESEVSSGRAARFLARVEDRLLSWVDANTWRNRRWEDVTEAQREALCKAVVIQAMYVFRNSDISMDSGYDPQRGIVAQKAELQGIAICDAAIDQLKRVGLYNHTMTNHYRWPRTI